MSKKLSIRGLKSLIDEVITEEQRRSSRRLSSSGKRSLANFLFEGEDAPADPATQGAEQAAEGSGKDFKEALAVLKGEAGSGQSLSEAISQGATATKTWLQSNGSTPGLLELLGLGLEDGDPESEVISQAAQPVPVSEIKATQNFISLHGSVGWPLSDPSSFGWWGDGGGSSGGFTDGRQQRVVCANSTEGVLVLDGHHRWSAAKCMGGNDFSIQAVVFNFPEGFNTPGAELAIGHVAIAAELGTGEVPSSAEVGGAGANILGQDIAEDIKGLIGNANPDNGKIYGGDEWFAALASEDANKSAAKKYGVTDEMLQLQVSEGEGEEAAGSYNEEQRKTIWETIATGIGANWTGAEAVDGPGRADMPQFGGGDTHDVSDSAVFDKMKSGAVNFKEPYVAESRTRNSGNLILERWTKLAGIEKK